MQKGMVSVVKACLIFIWCAILTGTNAMYSAYLLVGLLAAMCLIANGKDQPLRELLPRGTRAAAVVCAVLLSVAVTAANYKFFTSVGALNAVGHLLRCLKAAGLLLGGYVVFGEIIAFLAGRAADRGKNGAASVAPPCRRDLWVLFGSWAIIVAVNVTVLFLTQYPGVLTSDSTSQVRQTMTHTYSNHHPYYHTQIIHLLMNIGMALFGDINAAVATYAVFQIAAMGFIFAFAVFTLWQATRDRLFAMLAFLAYLLLPYHISYSFTVWKDVLFGGVVLLFALGSYRVLKNIMGLWLLQRVLQEQQINDLPALISATQALPACRFIINPNDDRFINPETMCSEIQAACRETAQPIPESDAELARCIFDSLALLYADVLHELAQLRGEDFSQLHIVGGGCQNTLLNQLCADACGIRVIAGPVEASTLGNIGIQLMTLDELNNVDDFRQVVSTTANLTTFTPNPDSEIAHYVAQIHSTRQTKELCA